MKYFRFMLKKYSLIAVLLIYVFPLDAQNLAEKNQLTIFPVFNTNFWQ